MIRYRHRKTAVMTTLVLALAVKALPAVAQDPDAPPGLDPGGPAIALISTGLDYTDPMIAPRLARDGEGQPIAWDFVDNDLKPYAPASANADDGTRLAKLILSANEKARLINVRVSRRELDSLAKAAMFVARTPARVAVVGTYPEKPESWELFGTAARQTAGHVLFIVPGGPATALEGASPYPVQLNLQNALTAAPLADNAGAPPDGEAAVPVDAWIKQHETGEPDEQATMIPADSLEAAALLAAYAACVFEGKTFENVTEAKAELQKRAQSIEDAGPKNVYDPRCANGE